MALARFFDAIDDVISSSSTISMPTGDFTFAAWVYPQSAGENNAGFIIQCLGGLAVARFRFAASTRTLTAVANHDGGTNATSTTTTTLSTNTWQLAIATYRASDKKMRVFIGSATSAMAEASYATQTAGTGSLIADATATVNVGNSVPGDRTWDGNIGPVVYDGIEWSSTQMSAYRLSLDYPTGTLKLVWMMDDRTASTVKGWSSTPDGTVTGCTLADGPPRGLCIAQRVAQVRHARPRRGGVAVLGG